VVAVFAVSSQAVSATSARDARDARDATARAWLVFRGMGDLLPDHDRRSSDHEASQGFRSGSRTRGV
jgi:hypothetical protein